MYSYRRYRKSIRAFALITVFVLTTLLSLIALELSQRSGINLKMAINYAQSKKALYYAMGGYHIALALLVKDTNGYDGPQDIWYEPLPPIPFDQGTISVSIEDEMSRFNVTGLTNQIGEEDKGRRAMLERMFRALSIEPSLIDALVDWQDTDDIQKPEGAEEFYYATLEPPYAPRNDKVLTPGELILVKGFSREVYFLPPASRESGANESFRGLQHYITVFGDGGINVNTADIPVLLSLSQDMDEFIVTDIVEYRKKNPFRRIEDLRKVESVSDILYDEIRSRVRVKSNYFRITATGNTGDFIRDVTAVVMKQSRGFRVVFFDRSL